jgi:diacylglycerol O-acyltransferase
MGIQDALWLEMDRPKNAMVADVAVWTAEPVNFELLQAALVERLVKRFPVFHSRAVRNGYGDWGWEPDPDFDIANHLSAATLSDPDDPRCMHALVAAHRTELLDSNRPLWQAIWVERYRGGSAMILRSHHAVADGMRMVQLAMSLFDASPQGGAILGPAVAQYGARSEPARLPVSSSRRGTAPGSTASRSETRWGRCTPCCTVFAEPSTAPRLRCVELCPAAARWPISSPPRPATSTPFVSSSWAPSTT